MSLQDYFDGFGSAVRGGALCEGDECGGWFLSEVDTWHECPCNARRAVPARHPEDDREDYVSMEDAEDLERARAAEEEADARFLSRDLPF